MFSLNQKVMQRDREVECLREVVLGCHSRMVMSLSWVGGVGDTKARTAGTDGRSQW